VVGRALSFETGGAINALSDDQVLAEGAGRRRVGRSDDGDDRRANGTSKVHRPGIVTDHNRAALKESGELHDGRPAGHVGYTFAPFLAKRIGERTLTLASHNDYGSPELIS